MQGWDALVVPHGEAGFWCQKMMRVAIQPLMHAAPWLLLIWIPSLQKVPLHPWLFHISILSRNVLIDKKKGEFHHPRHLTIQSAIILINSGSKHTSVNLLAKLIRALIETDSIYRGSRSSYSSVVWFLRDSTFSSTQIHALTQLSEPSFFSCLSDWSFQPGEVS